MGLFADQPETIFFDSVHVGDKGQEIIAAGIFKSIIDIPSINSAMQEK
jgi:hypothetical protein